jgi:hypothetical protein
MCCLDLPGERNGGELDDDVGVGFGVGVKRLVEFSKGIRRALRPISGAGGPHVQLAIGHNCGCAFFCLHCGAMRPGD